MTMIMISSTDHYSLHTADCWSHEMHLFLYHVSTERQTTNGIFWHYLSNAHTESGDCPYYNVIATADFLHKKNFSLINYVGKRQCFYSIFTPTSVKYFPKGIIPYDIHFYRARNARIASAVLGTAIPSVCLSVCLSVRPSHAGIVSKGRHVAWCSLHCWIAKCV